MKTIAIIKGSWKLAAIGATVSALALGGLFLNLRQALATNPNLTLKYLGINNTTGVGGWSHNVSVDAGQQVKLYGEIHNTNVPTVANNVKIRVTLPSTTGESAATVTAENAPAVTDKVAINVGGDGQLEYVPGSTKMTWDVNGDGNFEYKDTVMPDGIAGSGLILGNQQGCNQYIIQISFKANVVEKPKPSPTPTPVASPSPTPPVGGNTNVTNNDNDNENENNNEQEQGQSQENSQNQENNQTVNVTQNVTTGGGTVSGTSSSVPLKQPDTGPGVLGMASMFSAAPVGFALSRFGRGRIVPRRREENLGELATNLVEFRQGKSQDA